MIDSDGSDVSGDVTPSNITSSCPAVFSFTPQKIGTYTVIAKFICNGSECDSRSVKFLAEQEFPETKTPELEPLVVLFIALVVLGVLGRRK